MEESSPAVAQLSAFCRSMYDAKCKFYSHVAEAQKLVPLSIVLSISVLLTADFRYLHQLASSCELGQSKLV